LVDVTAPAAVAPSAVSSMNEMHNKRIIPRASEIHCPRRRAAQVQSGRAKMMAILIAVATLGAAVAASAYAGEGDPHVNRLFTGMPGRVAEAQVQGIPAATAAVQRWAGD